VPLVAFAVVLMATPACSVQRAPSSLDNQQRALSDVPLVADPTVSTEQDSESSVDDAGLRDAHANATQNYDLDHPNR